MTKKQNILLAAILSVSAIGGAAVAADAMAGPKGPMAADTNGDGVVSRSEFFAAADARYKARDANRDRKLSGDEMKDKGGRFARIDTNNDGVLTYEEAAAATSARFTRLDADQDGKLTPEEMRPMGERGHRHGPGGDDDGPGMRGARGGIGAMMLERVDTDKDGRISRDEMRAQADQRFDRLDVNKDGFVDKSELTARGRPGGRGDMPPPRPEEAGE